jgi:hypothetical protein
MQHEIVSAGFEINLIYAPTALNRIDEYKRFEWHPQDFWICYATTRNTSEILFHH